MKNTEIAARLAALMASYLYYDFHDEYNTMTDAINDFENELEKEDNYNFVSGVIETLETIVDDPAALPEEKREAETLINEL